MLTNYFIGVVLMSVLIFFHTMFVRKANLHVEDMVMALTGWVGIFAFIFISVHEYFARGSKKYKRFINRQILKNPWYKEFENKFPNA